MRTLGESVAEGVAGIDMRRVKSVQQQIHPAEQIRQRFWFAPAQGFSLQDLAVSHRLDLFGQMIVGFDEEAARAAGGVEHGFPDARVGDADHEAHDGARGIELAGIARAIAQSRGAWIRGARRACAIRRRR